MNVARARRRWRRWDRYISRCWKVGGAYTFLRGGYVRTEGRLLEHQYRKQERQARRDAQLVVGAVLDAYLPLAGGRP